MQNIGRVRKLLVGAVNLTDLSDGDARVCIEISTALLFHEAALGCSMANAACSAMCLAQAMRDVRDGRPAEGWLALRSAMRFAEDAREDLTATTYIPEPGYSMLSVYDLMAPVLSDALGLVVSAQEAEMADEDVLRGGAGAGAPEWYEDGDLALDFPEDTADLSRIQIPEPKPAPTLVVLAAGALDHLPGSSSSGSMGCCWFGRECDPLLQRGAIAWGRWSRPVKRGSMRMSRR